MGFLAPRSLWWAATCYGKGFKLEGVRGNIGVDSVARTLVFGNDDGIFEVPLCPGKLKAEYKLCDFFSQALAVWLTIVLGI